MDLTSFFAFNNSLIYQHKYEFHAEKVRTFSRFFAINACTFSRFFAINACTFSQKVIQFN